MRVHGGTAWAFIVGADDGGLILTQEHDVDGMALYIWALFGECLAPHKDAIYAELERIARECNARRIRMQSPREGWERESFFKRISVVYEHEVTNG